MIGTSTPWLLGQPEDRRTRLHALGSRLRRGRDLGHRHPFAQALAEGPVAGQRRHARRDEVTDAGQAQEGQRVRAQRRSQPCGLGQAAGDDRGLRVVAQAHPVGHTDGDRDDVLDGTAELGADDVDVGVGPEVRRRAEVGDPLCDRAVGARHDTGRGLAQGDLAGQVGPGQDGDPLRRHAGHLDDDLAHPPRRAELDALHQADDRSVRRQERAQPAEDPAQALRWQRQDDDLGVGERLLAISRGPDRLRQLDIRQVLRVGVRVVDLVRDLGPAPPQRDVGAGIGQDLGERRTPAARHPSPRPASCGTARGPVLAAVERRGRRRLTRPEIGQAAP